MEWKRPTDEERGTTVQELGPGSVVTLIVWLSLTGLYEWKQVRIVREQRRLAEHEAMVRMLTALGTDGRPVKVLHRGCSGSWAMEDLPSRSAGTRLPGRAPAGSRSVRRGR